MWLSTIGGSGLAGTAPSVWHAAVTIGRLPSAPRNVTPCSRLLPHLVSNHVLAPLVALEVAVAGTRPSLAWFGASRADEVVGQLAAEL